jgi:hypothetical protein
VERSAHTATVYQATVAHTRQIKAS